MRYKKKLRAQEIKMLRVGDMIGDNYNEQFVTPGGPGPTSPAHVIGGMNNLNKPPNRQLSTNVQVINFISRKYSSNLDESSEDDQKMEELNFDSGNDLNDLVFENFGGLSNAQKQKREEEKREFVDELAVQYIDALGMDQKSAVTQAHAAMQEMISQGQALVIPPELQGGNANFDMFGGPFSIALSGSRSMLAHNRHTVDQKHIHQMQIKIKHLLAVVPLIIH